MKIALQFSPLPTTPKKRKYAKRPILIFKHLDGNGKIFFKFSIVYRNGLGCKKRPSRAFSGATLQNKIDNRTAEMTNKKYYISNNRRTKPNQQQTRINQRKIQLKFNLLDIPHAERY